jgi:hypothetical protein
LEKAEREFLLQYLGSSRERLIGAVEGRSREQMRFRPVDRWSIADCVEHVATVEREALKRIRQSLMETVKRPMPSVPDNMILTSALDRSHRFVSHPAMLPRRRWTNFGDLVRLFEAARERTVRFAAVTQSDLRAHSFEHPDLGELDCYQWLLFLAAHCDRHVDQMEEVLEDLDFPRVRDAATA